MWNELRKARQIRWLDGRRGEITRLLSVSRFDLDGGAYRAVTPHAGGVSSTPQLPGSVTDASGLLDHPHAGDDERDWTGAGEKVRSAL